MPEEPTRPRRQQTALRAEPSVATVDEGAARDPAVPESAALTTAFLVAILLAAANLRAGLTGVGPLLPTIEHSTGLNDTWGSLLVTLPLLTFAAASPLAGRAARRHGPQRVLAASLPVLAAGLVLRSLPGTLFLFGGTIVIAAAIAAGNVLLPPIVRGTMPDHRVGQVTSLYVTAMGLVAAISSGVSVPLADALPGGWRSALGCWALLALIAIPAWLPYLRRTPPPELAAPPEPTAPPESSAPAEFAASAKLAEPADFAASPEPTAPAAFATPANSAAPANFAAAAPTPTSPWRSALAWQISLFMGLQSLGFYATIAWLPSIVHDHGTAAATAGWELFLFQAVGLIASSTLPLLTRRRADQRRLAAAFSALTGLGFALLALAPDLAVLTCVLTGFGAGATLVLALTFQSRRGPQAAALAAMAQAVGYTVAAIGPLLLGTLHGATGGWTLPLTLLAALACAQAVVGLGAGRDTT